MGGLFSEVGKGCSGHYSSVLACSRLSINVSKVALSSKVLRPEPLRHRPLPLLHCTAAGCPWTKTAFTSAHLRFLVWKMGAVIPTWQRGFSRDSRVWLGTNVLSSCTSNSSFIPCARYRGQCFRAPDSGDNQDAGVRPGNLAHSWLPPEQASHHHRPHQAGQRGGQVRHMLGTAMAKRVAGEEAAQTRCPPSPLLWPGVEHCTLETTSCPSTAPARSTAPCSRPPSCWPVCQRKCSWRSCLRPKVGGP